MKTIKCPECGLVDWSNVEMCRRCCHFFQSVEDQASEIEPPQNSFDNQQTNQFADHQEFTPQNDYQSDYQNSESSTQDNVNEFAEDQQFESEYVEDQGFQDGYSQNYGYQQNQYQQPQQNNFSQAKPKIKIAIASMVFGILGFPFIWFVWAAVLVGILAAIMGITGAILGGGIAFLVIPLSLILGIVALVKIKKYPSQYGGKGFAITGIIISSISIIFLPILGAVAIPNLLAARKAANEGSAIASVRQISEAQATFMSQNRGRCGTLEELGRLQLVDGVLAKGQKTGYIFVVAAIPSESGGCEVMATPTTDSVGNRSFYYSTEDQTFRAEDKNGEMADKNSPVLDSLTSPIRPQISENY